MPKLNWKCIIRNRGFEFITDYAADSLYTLQKNRNFLLRQYMDKGEKGNIVFFIVC